MEELDDKMGVSVNRCALQAKACTKKVSMLVVHTCMFAFCFSRCSINFCNDFPDQTGSHLHIEKHPIL